MSSIISKPISTDIMLVFGVVLMAAGLLAHQIHWIMMGTIVFAMSLLVEGKEGEGRENDGPSAIRDAGPGPRLP